MIYQEHAHRKLRQAFDAILQQFSSNANRKSMLSANRSFQAQNSTCSTLLQTMLLYETCIVLSRKCLWDVNKDFWHQWCSLVITTLSARAIYRQIPVSYLQTRHTTTISVHSGTTPVQFRCNSSAIPVQFQCNSGATLVQLRYNYHYLRASLLYRWTWFRSPNRCSNWFGFV